MRWLLLSNNRGWRLRIAFISLMLADAILTAMAVPRGFDELNPVVAALLEEPTRFAAVKVVGPTVLALVVPGLLLLPSVLFLVGVVAWNVAQLAFHAFA